MDHPPLLDVGSEIRAYLERFPDYLQPARDQRDEDFHRGALFLRRQVLAQLDLADKLNGNDPAFPVVNVYAHPETGEIVADFAGETRSWYAVLADLQSAGCRGYTKPCGCRKNLGGWRVSDCAEHVKSADAAVLLTRCDHGRLAHVRCDLCEVEADEVREHDERSYREVAR